MTTSRPTGRSSAEKRALWEIRQRYHVEPTSASTTPRPARSGGSDTPPPPKGPKNPRRTPLGKSGKPHAHWGRRIGLLVAVLVLLSGGIFGYKILAAGNKISVAERSLIGQLKDLLLSSDEQLKGEKDDRINILLLAIGGEGHSGENLADTVIVASIRPSDHKVALLSIPRDLYVQVPGEEYFSKINSVHAYGEAKGKDQGPELMRQKVEDITGLPMHYFIRGDFTAFKHLVDAVGGVNITIEETFFDYWHKISFPAGTEEMNGERALAFVRARYIEGPQGGDFQRAARQQQVLLAIQDKVFSVQTAFDFNAVNGILNALSKNIRTDLQLWEMKRFYEMARTIDDQQVASVVLTTGPKGVLTGGTEILGGVPASVLRPRTGDYSEIQAIASNIFSTEVAQNISPSPSAETSEEPEPTPTTEPSSPAAKPTLEVRNGTNTTGLASRTKTTFEKAGYQVIAIGNATDRATAKTTAYIINDEFSNSAAEAAELIDADTDSGLPSGEAASQADVLIILGADASS